mmetsp:Transcript_36795/g.92510  ORF Transcript_36795/g.92510 Transcript_36795/m.92510 type:complete len:243 (-) Transcript_36795:706-1434(-)
MVLSSHMKKLRCAVPHCDTSASTCFILTSILMHSCSAAFSCAASRQTGVIQCVHCATPCSSPRQKATISSAGVRWLSSKSCTALIPASTDLASRLVPASPRLDDRNCSSAADGMPVASRFINSCWGEDMDAWSANRPSSCRHFSLGCFMTAAHCLLASCRVWSAPSISSAIRSAWRERYCSSAPRSASTDVSITASLSSSCPPAVSCANTPTWQRSALCAMLRGTAPAPSGRACCTPPLARG